MRNGSDEMESIQALTDFAIDLRAALDESCFEPTGNVRFDASVSYSHSGKATLGSAVVYLTRNGYDDGTVTLLESKQFDPNKVHTQYTAKWQTYKYDQSTKTFTVSGKSSKYRYDYTVEIRPV